MVTIKDEFTPSVYNNPDLADRIVNVLRTVLNDEQLIPGEPVMGGEDFARYGRVEPKIPTPASLDRRASKSGKYIAAAMESGEALPSLHSPFFAPDPQPTIQTGVEVMTTGALELLGKVGD